MIGRKSGSVTVRWGCLTHPGLQWYGEDLLSAAKLLHAHCARAASKSTGWVCGMAEGLFAVHIRFIFQICFCFVSWFIGNYFTITARGILFSVSSFVNGLALFSVRHVQMQMELISCMVTVTLTELFFFCSLLCVCGHSWMHRLMGRLILSVTVWLWSMYACMICRWKGSGLESEN